MTKFLIIQTAFIGDVVLATGIAEKLHTAFPDAIIEMLVRKGNETLLENHPFISEVLVWNKKQNKIRNLFKMLSVIRKKRYDKVINIQRFAATGILTAFSAAKEKIGFDKNPFSFLFTKKIPHLVAPAGEFIHEIKRNHQLIRHFTDDQEARPVLYPVVADFQFIKFYEIPPYITVSPASVWFTKQYPPEKWKSFLFEVPSHVTIYLLGAASDAPLAELIAHGIRAKIINLCGKLTFLQSAALMKNAVMNFVNDSAPLHFASAMNAPVAAVYCSTIPAFGFGPLSKNQSVIEIRSELYCRPCGLHGYHSCPEGHFFCAYKINDTQLLEVLQGVI
ncbi:MAG TPA: glycosyltransferase family 9 protein [Flavitalea sp.]|nr:glycosyltransferase family 9 protein [Flavitalea sp.]